MSTCIILTTTDLSSENVVSQEGLHLPLALLANKQNVHVRHKGIIA